MNKSKGKKNVVQTHNHVKKPFNLTLRSKVNVVLGSWMNATLPLMVIHPNIVNQFQSKKKSFGRTRRHVKPYEFDLEFKGQHRTGIMNVRNILSHGDTPMWQIWQPVSKGESYGPDTNYHRQTGRQTNSYIPRELCSGGYKYYLPNYNKR